MTQTVRFGWKVPMRLVRFRTPEGHRIGALEGSYVHEVALDGRHVSDMIELIAEGRRVTEMDVGGPMPLDGEAVRAPLRPPRGLICVGRNYRDHAEELSRSGYDATQGERTAGGQREPAVIFLKPASAIIGPGEEIDPHDDVTSALDYEAELGVIVGPGGARIRERDAWNHVWGYTIVNDVTARDLQHRHRQWFLGKSLDTFAPLGPWAVERDDVDGANLEIRCKVNGELRQQANTSALIYSIPELIEIISAGIELVPGDVIATGTPAGVGIGFDPPRFLAPGDEIAIEITGLGMLTNRVGQARLADWAASSSLATT